MEPSTLFCVEKTSVHVNSPVPHILQRLEETRARLLNPVRPPASWVTSLTPPGTQGHGVAAQQEICELSFLGPKCSSLVAQQEKDLEECRARLLQPIATVDLQLTSSKVWDSPCNFPLSPRQEPFATGLSPDNGVQEEAFVSDSKEESLQEEEEEEEEEEMGLVDGIPKYVLVAPEDKLEQTYEETDALVAEIAEDSKGLAVREQKLMLLSLVCCSLVEGPKFGNPPGKLQAALMQTCKSLAEFEPEFILKVALYTRQELNIRSTANFLLALATCLSPCRPHLRRYFCHGVQLPSDWMQVAKLYQSLTGEGNTLAPVPSCLRAAMADRFRQFDAYQLAKYNTRKSRGKKRCKPKIAKPRTNPQENWKKHSLCRNTYFAKKIQELHKTFQENLDKRNKAAPKDRFCLKALIHRLHISEPAQHVMSLLGRRYPSDLSTFSRSRLPGPWDPSLAGTRMRLPAPKTWERELSLRGNKAEVWEELIDSGKLPFMAMLRNLSNILKSGVSERHHRCILKRLADKDSVIHSRQLPFRFLSAYKVILLLEQKLKEKEEPFPPNAHFVGKILRQMRIPDYMVRRRTLRACMEIPAIFQMVKLEKKKLLKSRDLRYSHALLQRYCQALEKAIAFAVQHNMPPIPGRTLILISCSYLMFTTYLQGRHLCCPNPDGRDCSNQQNEPLSIRQMAMLLGSMIYSACEQAQVFFCERPEVLGPVAMTGSVLKDVQTLQTLSDATFYGTRDSSAEDIINDFLTRREHVDTILFLTYRAEELHDSCLQLYRHHVASDCLFANICAYAGNAKAFNSRKEVVINGFSEHMIRFMAACGDSRLLEHVGKADEIHGLPKKRETASPKQETEVVPLIPAPQRRWRSVRVFVSSTFRDMHGERDLLIRSVFPELRARAAIFCLAVQDVDLRWGITEQESRQNKQLELCLSEVWKSDLFIGILGERYGHVSQAASLPDEPQYEWVKSYPPGRSITELEAIQFLNGCNNPSAGSRAFFYLREPDFLSSVPEGWKKDFVAESEEAAQHLTELKEHLGKRGDLAAFSRYVCQWGGVAQGQPYVKGLEDFGKSVLQNIWKCLQDQFIEGDGSKFKGDSEEEEGNFAQQSFQEVQQRRFCARTKLLHATVAQLRGGKLYVVSGESGQGKTVFLAALAEELRTMVPPEGGDLAPSSHVVAHFTSAGPNQAEVQVVLAHLCASLRRLLEEPPTPVRSYRGLVAQFKSLLYVVAKSLKQKQSLKVLIDGADLVHGSGGQLVSDWLPEQVPQRVSLVLSVSVESALLMSLRQRKDAVFVPLEPLAPPDRAVIIRKDLAMHGKKLEESAFNNQMRLVLLKRGSRQPLYLRLLTQDLRLFALYEKLTERIKELPVSLPLLLQHLLSCLEQGHGREMVAVALTSLWASRDGLMEQDLYAILATWKELNGACITLEKAMAAGSHVGNFPTALFLDFLRSLRGLLGACGSPSESPGSRLQLCGTPMRMAVERRYVTKLGLTHTAHVLLAAHWWILIDPDGSKTFRNCEAEPLIALPYHLVQSGHFNFLATFLTDLRVLSAHIRLRLLPGLSKAYALYEKAAGSEGSEAVSFFAGFLRRNLELLSQNPLLLLQQAANEPDSSDLCLQAQEALGKSGKPFLKWINKPKKAQLIKSLVWNLPSTPSCVCLAPSGKLAVVGTTEGTLHLVEMETGQELKSLLSSCDGISACTFLSETTICLGAFDGRLELWSLREGCRLMGKDAHKAQITDCCINSDRKLLASVSLDGSLKIWDSACGHLIHQQDFLRPLNCVTFHPKGQLVATSGWDRSVTILDAVQMNVISVLKDHDASICSISFSSTGNILAVGSLAGSITLWSWLEKTVLGSFLAHSGCVSVSQFLSDGKLLTAGEDCKVQVYKGHLGQFWSRLGSTALSPALCIAPNLDGNLLAVGHHSDGIWIYSHPWRLKASQTHCQGTGVAVCSLAWLDNTFLVGGIHDGTLCIWNTLEPRSSRFRQLKGHDKAVMGLAVSKKLVASVSEDFTLRLWLSETLRPGPEADASILPLTVLHGHTAGVTCCAFSLDGCYLATGGKDQALLFWDVRDPSQKTPSLWRSLPFCHQDWISACAWTGSMLLSGSNDETVCLWDPKTSQCLRRFLGHQSPICGVTSENDHVISMGRDGMLIAWNLEGVEETRFLAHPSQTNHCAGFRDLREKGLMLAAAGSDGTVKLWKPLMMEQPQVLFGHYAPVCAAAASASSSFLTVSKDKTVRIWGVPKDEAGGTEGAPPHHSAVTAVAWSPDGDLAASGGEDGELIVWREGEPLGTAKVGPQGISALIFAASHKIFVACNGISLWDVSGSGHRVGAVSLTYKKSLWQAKKLSVLCMGMLRPLGYSVCGLADGSLLILQPGAGSFEKNEHLNEQRSAEMGVVFDISVCDEEEDVFHVWHSMEKPSLLKMKVTKNGKFEETSAIDHVNWTPSKASSYATAARLMKGKFLYCADSEGFLWTRTLQCKEEVEEEVPEDGWQRTKVHSDRITALHLLGDRIITASRDRDVKIWDRSTMKLLGQFRCRAPVSCLQPCHCANSSVLLMAGDVLGTVYFLDWGSLSL